MSPKMRKFACFFDLPYVCSNDGSICQLFQAAAGLLLTLKETYFRGYVSSLPPAGLAS
jgi:hypothetical protein